MMTAIFVTGLVVNLVGFFGILGLIWMYRHGKLSSLAIYSLGLGLFFINPFVALGYIGLVWAIGKSSYKPTV